MASSKLSLKFRIYKNNELVGFRELNQAVIKIGKVPTAHVCLEDDSVSRMHAIVEILDTQAHIIDLGSTRGTFVNGQRINKAKRSDGDLIQCGDMRLELAMVDATAEAPVVVAAPVPPPLPVAKPVATSTFVTAPAAPAAFAAAMMNDEPGARAVEVATMLGDSVVDVKHCMDPKSGKVTAKTWGFVAGGLACLLTSAAAFYVSVDTAAQNKASLAYHVDVLKKPAYSHRPKQVGVGVDYLAFGGLAFGLLGLTAGLARARGEKKSPYYRIGTAPGVEQPVDNAPSADFPMVAPSGDDFVFNYGAGMDGEMILDGKSTPLADLVSAGRARPSASTAGAIEVPIPAKAKIRARAGQTTFLVTAVNKPAKQAVPLFNMERRTAAYVAGSLAIHMGIIAFLQTIPVEDSGVQVTFNMDDGVSMKSSTTSLDDVPPEIEESPDVGGGESEGGGTMALPEGATGHPDKPANNESHIRIKDRGETKQMTREQAIEQAQNAGVLGSYQNISGGIVALAGTADFSSGFDGTDVYGALFGAEGEGQGSFGGGRYGMGGGGGCYGTDCGIIGTGRYKTIGNGPGAGPGGWGPRGSGNPWRRHDAGPPKVTLNMPTESGGLDKAIIKRYMKRQTAKISYCYESELLVNPNLSGVVNVQFLITAQGSVSVANGAGMSPKVANCVAGIVKNIEFPKPANGGNVQVNYPFTFRAAGQ
ncbi:MAG: AgmX/PglI C-terminal domain-containing protein [Deltaproteobacteria bacterium]|nr:AgmX/PglI C-terminal domain-containing protein [Deltaproteobacteria bacterium]